MDGIKVSGYGIKVAAHDSRINIKAIAENFAKVDQLFTKYLYPPLDGATECTNFSLLALSFRDLIAKEFPLLEFVFLDDKNSNSFAIVTKDSSTEITDGVNPVGANTYNDFYDSHMLRQWVKEFLPGYEFDADWIFEDIRPDDVGRWKKRS